MPKTRNAFAFRDFDKTRILQRPYFKNFGYTNLTDEEILKSLSVNDSDSIDVMEKTLSTIKALYKRGSELQSLILRHIKRLEYFVERHGDSHTAEYLLVIHFDIVNLLNNFGKKYKEVEEKIQKKYKEDLITRLKQYRKAAGLTQKELGDLVEVSPLGYSRYERGEREIPIHTVIRLAKVFHISGDEILGLK